MLPRAAAPPLLLSLTAHALLLAGLWLWPGGPGRHAGRVTDTRVDLCFVEEAPPPYPASAATAAGPDVGVAAPWEPTMREGPADLGPGAPPAGSIPQVVGLPPAARGGPAGGHPGGGGLGLFPAPAATARVVYVVDRSVSMGLHDTLAVARRELLEGLRRLPAGAHFQVVAYNDVAEPLTLGGRTGLLPADPDTVERAALLVAALDARGPTDHVGALRCGLGLHPDLLYFVTDADELSGEDVARVTQLNQGFNDGHTAIHTVELTRQPGGAGGPLQRLASANHGTYRRVSAGR